MPSRILSGHDAGPRRRTDRARIRTGKRHPACSEPLDIRRLIERRLSIERRIRPAEIIGQNENDIGLTVGLRDGDWGKRECQNEYYGVLDLHLNLSGIVPKGLARDELAELRSNFMRLILEQDQVGEPDPEGCQLY